MATSIGKLWVGKLFGTNTGNLFIEFKETEPGIQGFVRVMDDKFGITVYEVTGAFTDRLRITSKPTKEVDE